MSQPARGRVNPRPPIVLASRSPQRRALLGQLGLPFVVREPDYDEQPLELLPADLVEERSRGKARSVAADPRGGPIVGVDTEVSLHDGLVLGKPGSTEEAAAMLAGLQGRAHSVLSGLCVRHGTTEIVGHAVTTVHFRTLTGSEIAAYVAHGEWRGRAGGYAVQGLGAALVERVEGCYPNVVGLPVALLVRSLARVGYPVIS